MNSRICFLIAILAAVLPMRVRATYFCESVIKSYYECKHLKMVFSDYSYKADWTVPGNRLNRSFYESIFNNITTIEQALDLQRDIYMTAITSCSNSFSSEFCRCMRGISGYSRLGVTFGFALGDQNMYTQFKRTILDYVNEFGMKNQSSSRSSPLSTELWNFCSTYDIIFYDHLNLYNINLPPCMNNSFQDYVCNHFYFINFKPRFCYFFILFFLENKPKKVGTNRRLPAA